MINIVWLVSAVYVKIAQVNKYLYVNQIYYWSNEIVLHACHQTWNSIHLYTIQQTNTLYSRNSTVIFGDEGSNKTFLETVQCLHYPTLWNVRSLNFLFIFCLYHEFSLILRPSKNHPMWVWLLENILSQRHHHLYTAAALPPFFLPHFVDCTAKVPPNSPSAG